VPVNIVHVLPASLFCFCSLLTVLYGQVTHAMKVHDRLLDAEAELDELKGIKHTPAPTTKQVVTGGQRDSGTNLEWSWAGSDRHMCGSNPSWPAWTAQLLSRAVQTGHYGPQIQQSHCVHMN
jgi:hypothetical protein